MNNDLKSWDEGANNYLQNASEDNDPFKKWVDTPKFLSFLGNILGKRILDIGCGNGDFCKLLVENGAEVTGLDGSAAMIEVANQNAPANCKFIVADILNDTIPFEEGYFDIVTAKMMLMNISPLEAIAGKVFYYLKNGGQFALDIVHPLRPLLKNSMNKESKYANTFNYFKELNGGIEFSGKKMAFYYRPLQDYLNSFVNAGFTFKKVQELGADEELVAKFPELKDKLNFPVSLHLLFCK